MPEAQKGAHYSVPMHPGTPRPRPLESRLPQRLDPGVRTQAPRRLAAVSLLIVLPLASPTHATPQGIVAGAAVLTALASGVVAGAAVGGASSETETRKAEEQLQAVKSEIERVTREVSAEQVERDRMTRALRSAELSVGKARESLGELRRQRAEDAARRAALTTEKRTRESELDQNRAALAGQLRAAYLIGRQEPLKLLLNQEDPALAARMFVYYGYFGRARAGQIRLIEDDVGRLAELARELEAEDERLAQLETQQREELHELEQARERRSVVLANLETQSHSRAQNLERLRTQQAGLEKLLRELRAAMERFPVEGNDAFSRLRGKLAWPVNGHLVARFGDARAGGVRWDGVLVATERGAPVKAVCAGRVIYADWLPGLGLLAIVDHGDGYLSLYGHNERLYKAAGEQVVAGDTIAAAGDSGGSPRPELYFEIRKGGKPVDPRPWFKAVDP
jgi:murein hydrolase activator